MYAGRKGVKGCCTFKKKMLLMAHCDFEKGSKNQHFQSTLLVGRGDKKITLCTLLTMLTILDDPLHDLANQKLYICQCFNVRLYTAGCRNNVYCRKSSRPTVTGKTCHLRLAFTATLEVVLNLLRRDDLCKYCKNSMSVFT